MTKSNLYVSFIIICIFFVLGCRSNKIVWSDGKILSKDSTDNYHFPIGKGTVYTKNEGNLKGLIFIQPIGHKETRGPYIPPEIRLFPEFFNTLYKEQLRCTTLYRKFAVKEVDSLSMLLPQPYGGGDFTLFVNFKNKEMGRLNGRKGDISIYDFCVNGNNEPISWYTNKLYYTTRRMLLINKSDTFTIFNFNPVFFSYSDNRASKRIVKFINKRYKIGVTVKDFANPREMLEYIIDKENERVNNSSSKP